MAVLTDDTVRLAGVSKKYFFLNRFDDLHKAVWHSHELEGFWALKNINFSLRPGDVLGVLGSNGSGKTTLLKVITGLSDYQGSVVSVGKLKAIIGTGIGVKEFLTLEELIYRILNLYGESSISIKQSVDEILDFSELESRRKQLYHTLSSGMQSRLLLGILTSVESNILLIDEFICAGDEHFVGKSYKRILRLAQSGKTLMIVSHNWTLLKRMCNKLVWIDAGEIKKWGEPEDVVMAYLHSAMGRSYSTHPEESVQQTESSAFDPDPELYERFLSIQDSDCFYEEGVLNFTIQIRTLTEVPECRVYINILLDDAQDWCFVAKCEKTLDVKLDSLKTYKIKAHVSSHQLSPGGYRYGVFITPLKTDGVKKLYSKKTWIESPKLRFFIDTKKRNPSSGLLRLNLDWNLKCVPGS